MIWRNKHRAGRKKRIAALQKRSTIVAVKTGHYIADQAKQQLRRAARRAQHANRPTDHNVEIIDLRNRTGHQVSDARNEPNLPHQPFTQLKSHNSSTE